MRVGKYFVMEWETQKNEGKDWHIGRLNSLNAKDQKGKDNISSYKASGRLGVKMISNIYNINI